MPLVVAQDSEILDQPINASGALRSARSATKPELLAPAGDRQCLIAAIENGADAVYFGLQRFNARIRATNFDGRDLPEVMGLLHRRGVKGYVALNTLVFPSELESMEAAIRELTLAGVDAVIIQDMGLARLIRSITPDVEIHASTQMSVTSAEGVELAKELGCSRVILARELSLTEIGRIKKAVDLPLEVFVHGALCVAYSGQCLTSEALGGRSANRGECAQACRMPYQIVCDGKLVDLDNTKYLLSPQDLAAYDLVPELIDLGVASLKIEGRLKTAEYVANITRHYRQAIDAAWAGEAVVFSPRDVQEMQLSFSRGFSHGFLDGNDHKVLVRGDYAKKRGILIGTIESVTRGGVRIRALAPIKPGDGVVFDGDDSTGLHEQGGRVYQVEPVRPVQTDLKSVETAEANEIVELRFGRESIELENLVVGQRLWKTDDPELTRRLRKSFQGPPARKIGVRFYVDAEAGQLLSLSAMTETGVSAKVSSNEPLNVAETSTTDLKLLENQLSRLGGTIYEFIEVKARVAGNPMVPKSLLNQLRRQLIENLDATSATVPSRSVCSVPALSGLLSAISRERDRQFDEKKDPTTAPELAVLCRTTEQVESAIGQGVKTIYADYQDIKKYYEAVATVRRGEAEIFIATPRIEKPGEANLFHYLAKQRPDGLLVRNAGGLSFCVRKALPFIADFSLNAANPLTVELLNARGARKVTASYDLNVDQLLNLIDGTPPNWLEIVIHQQVPMFHMEHCVFCAFLSPGTDKSNCGRPCDHHNVKLRDRVGAEHPLTADVGCRNTLFNATPQSAAEFLPRFLAGGARNFRIEFLEENGASVERIIGLYRDVLEGRGNGKKLFRELNATGQYGVTRGPLAIL